MYNGCNWKKEGNHYGKINTAYGVEFLEYIWSGDQ